jgi:hypothetical protein
MSLSVIAQKVLSRVLPSRYYCEDALLTTHVLTETQAFKDSYSRGLKALGGQDYHNRWRVHVALWVASRCARLEGDFVECGVNYGLNSSAIMHHLNWNNQKKHFWLVDSFDGVNPAQVSEEALEVSNSKKRSGFYNCSAERAKQNFSEWPNAHVIKGWVPQCLDSVKAEKVAYLHLDMNAVQPEVQALEYFRPKLVPGAMVLLDDYGYAGGGNMLPGWRDADRMMKLDILSLPTGQGLIVV